jgi:lysophospholipase L1-like esterase
VPPEPPPPTDPYTAKLQAFIREHASPTALLPAQANQIPSISWAGPFAPSLDTLPTSLPTGRLVAASDPAISKAIAQHYGASVPGQPVLAGLPCLRPLRHYTCKGMARTVGSIQIFRFKTDAPIVELTGVIADGVATVLTLIVDGELVPTKVLSSDRGNGGGWNVGTVRIDFGARRFRDVWIETTIHLAYLKVGQIDYLLPVDDANDVQITVIGDSYLQARSEVFGNGAAIALSAAARLGIRKVATDAIGGTGYWNSAGDTGSLIDRLAGHAADGSDIYLVMAGINDYGDIDSTSTLRWPTTEQYESGVHGYFEGLRSARPNALIVATAPFCPVPPMSDASQLIGSPATNARGIGDNLYKAAVVKEALQSIVGPWIYIDVLMGTGWLNSSGAVGDITNLQWLTGGTPGPNTSATHKPGNTHGGGGGGGGVIDTIPVLIPGRYRQAPEIVAVGGSGKGLLVASRIDSATGALKAVVPIVPGHGYRTDALPSFVVDPTFEIEPATLGTPTLQIGINPDGQYPLLSFAPPGVSPAELNNIYTLLGRDTVHPSSVGAEHFARRLADNIRAAVLAL